MIAFFSPNIQLIYGLLFIRYRVNVYLISNLGQDLSENIEIDPFGEYGAKIPITILVFQIFCYGLLLLVCLNGCRGAPKTEPNIIEPEEDIFATPS